MKRLLIALLVVAISFQSVLSYGCAYPKECLTYKYALDEIDRSVTDQAYNHNLNVHYDGGQTYLSRVQYILKALNDKITNSYRTSSRGSSGNSFGCKQLEDEILARSKEFGIEKIGLESNLIRLRKVFDHQDERNNFNLYLLVESNNKTQTCELNRSALEDTIKSVNLKNNEQARKIKQQEEHIKSLEKETRRLQAKLNANAPAIHGETGKIYPEVGNPTPTSEAAGPAVTSTTEMAVPPPSSDTITTVAEDSEANPVPDIDLRNNDGDSS